MQVENLGWGTAATKSVEPVGIPETRKLIPRDQDVEESSPSQSDPDEAEAFWIRLDRSRKSRTQDFLVVFIEQINYPRSSLLGLRDSA